jgi:hypothetical protein
MAKCGHDPALFQAIEGLFNSVSTALQPGILATQAYIQQLINARPTLQYPLAGVNAERRQMDGVLVYAGIGLAVLLIFLIVYRSKE